MFKICRIITETTDATNSLKEYLGGYPVEITQRIPEENYFDIPTLMIGWNSVSHRFPKQDIGESNVTHNLTWTYNQKESEETLGNNAFYRSIDEFINKNLINWLPSNFRLYDPIINDDLHNFIVENINTKEITYIHFNNGVLYMNNDGNNFVINVEAMKITEDNYKFAVTRILNNLDCMIYSYNGIEEFVDLELLSNVKTLDIIRWIKYGVETPIKYFQIIPGIDISKYVPFLMSKVPLEDFTKNERRFFERMCVRDNIARWMSNQYISFSYDFNKKLDFKYRQNAKLAKINFSTKRTLTGRIVSRDKFNPQNLDKSNEERTFIVSRYRGGKVYQFDYTSFETRIALYLSGDSEFIQLYYDADLHYETGKIIYETQQLTFEQREKAKLVNHSIIYGAGDATIIKHMHNVEYPEEKMLEVKRFLHPMFNKRDEIQKELDEKGYITNKWGSIIKPDKVYAGFNNYVQSTASEIMVDKTYEIRDFLKGLKSKFMFQVHDSVVIDIHPEEFHIAKEIAKILSYNRGMLFTVNYKSGINYRDLSSEVVYF